MNKLRKTALFLSGILFIQSINFPMPTSAAENSVKEITEFMEPSDDILFQTVPYGTKEKDLKLPKRLTVLTVSGESETSSKSEAAKERKTKVKVEWELNEDFSAEPKYNGKIPGIYIYDAVVDEDKYEVSAELPRIEIEVSENETTDIATGSDAFVSLYSSATGDLWDEWNSDMDWEGTGTEKTPFKISSLSELMGLSEAVAQGESYKGKYFELTEDIDLGNIEINSGCWNPVGWYKNATDLGGEPDTAFKGTFDGAGNTIRGLKFTKKDYSYKNLGLFGVLEDATVEDLTIEADEVSGDDNVGILAGSMKGKTKIKNVTVSGVVYAENGDAGGIAGEVTGDSGEKAVIENSTADNIVVNSEGNRSYVGGIAGNIQNAYIVDTQTVTQDGSYNRVQGKGYVGGIAGRQRDTDIYNSFVSGTIGGNGSKAAGGITGCYESGNISVARFDGEIGSTNMGASAHEGSFIGYRDSRNGFTYGTGKKDNLSYLFTGSETSVKNAVGSDIDGDNTWTKDAHIGYWTDFQKKYVTVAGNTTEGCGDRYFYEELEDGIKYIITQKLDKTVDVDYADGEAFRIDHFAPGNQGEPVRGYLVSIPRIDARNQNGTYDTDVAILTAIGQTNNSYYRKIDKDNPSAVAAGDTVSVVTAANNKDGNRYQMVYDENEPGKVKPPTYTDEEGKKQDMTYISGGSYTFVMPENDTELNVEYIKVTTELAMTPEETTVTVTQTRSGDRKNPDTVTEVRNNEGILIARYIGADRDESIEIDPIRIHAEHNGAGSAADKTVLWSVDDTDLIDNQSETGYTNEDARIMPNLNSQFIQGIINKAVKNQADGGYREAIDNTIYKDTAVVTAATNPDTSVDNKAVYGNTKVTVAFQIKDNTTLRVEGLNLNRRNIDIEITRKLTGSRVAPTETYSITGNSVVLDATLYPEQPFYKNVTWQDKEAGKIIKLSPGGTNNQECTVTVNFSGNGTNNPAWIQNVINADNAIKANDKYAVLKGSATMKERITATSEDQTHGTVSASCDVTLIFKTVDETGSSSGGHSGGSSGGGGGGGSSSGITPSGSVNSVVSGGPAGVVTGTWVQDATGNWLFTGNGRTYVNEWAYIHNPYAGEGQNSTDWFRFNEQGYMVTGWFVNEYGDIYYLNPVSDNTLGRMLRGWNMVDGAWRYFENDDAATLGRLLTGWQWIDGNGDGVSECYRLDPNDKGKLFTAGVTPDGYTVDAEGRWTVDGVVQTRGK